jgi:hypothetical protein
MKVPILDPLLAFVGMPSFRPLPQTFPDLIVHPAKGLFGATFTVVLRPSSDYWV